MLKKLLLSILAVILIFEEWLWDTLTVAGQFFSRILHLERFDAWLIESSPKRALFAFFIPLVIVTPFNILAVFLLARGAILEAILLEIVLKLSATLLIARIFRLVKPALLTFNWFSTSYTYISDLLHWAHESVRHTAIYQLSLTLKAAVKARVAALFQSS
ncbi:MAG: hypothetical protein RLZZ384_1262 [Pseudomonadota bacterium]|nr:hypothetical protein [Pseudomonadota bacterium]